MNSILPTACSSYATVNRLRIRHNPVGIAVAYEEQPTAPSPLPRRQRSLRLPLESLVLAVLLPACSTTPPVQTETKAGSDFAHLRTFALMPLPTTAPVTDPGLMLRAAEPARQAAVEALTAKELTQVDRAQADIAVNLRGQSLPKIEITGWGYRGAGVYGRMGRYQGRPGYVPGEVRNTEEGTLTIEIFDNRTKELAWVGWSQTDATGPVEVKRLQEAIRAILAKFPPRSK